VLDLPVNNSGEGGLEGIAIMKNTTNTSNSIMMNKNNTTAIVFLYFKEAVVDKGTPLGNRLYRYEWNGTTLINPKLLLDLPATKVEHNAGKLAVGPDGNLYAIIGDQDSTTVLQNVKNGSAPNDTGVIFRLTQDGLPAKNNPFANSNNQKMKKYFAYGIRNSFGLAIDPITGKLWDTENGDTQYDEINLVKPGFNSGWAQVMGPIKRTSKTVNDLVNFPGSKYADPVFSWKTTVAPTDIEFLNSSKLGQQYANNIFVGDYDNGNLYYFEVNGTRTGLKFNADQAGLSDHVADDPHELSKITFGKGFGSITDIKTGPDGFLYILTFGGKIYRIMPKSGTMP
jgi:aldose sugar dehydrogenase